MKKTFLALTVLALCVTFVVCSKSPLIYKTIPDGKMHTMSNNFSKEFMPFFKSTKRPVYLNIHQDGGMEISTSPEYGPKFTSERIEIISY